MSQNGVPINGIIHEVWLTRCRLPGDRHDDLIAFTSEEAANEAGAFGEKMTYKVRLIQFPDGRFFQIGEEPIPLFERRDDLVRHRALEKLSAAEKRVLYECPESLRPERDGATSFCDCCRECSCICTGSMTVPELSKYPKGGPA